MNKLKIFIFIVVCINVLIVLKILNNYKFSSKNTPYTPADQKSAVSNISPVTSLDKGKWSRCLRTLSGTIYFQSHIKSPDGGKTTIPEKKLDFSEINAEAERAVISENSLFYAAGGAAQLIKPGIYSISAWRSSDGLKTISKEKATVYVPEGPVHSTEKNEWYGLYVYRTIVKMPDGTWLMTMYGNFKGDNLSPQENDAKKETKFLMRTFVVKSADNGHSWYYLASVAIPNSGDPVGEGFVEPAITLLNDGRLLCIMRSGHHFPLYSSWSSDSGKTWTHPIYTGLDRGCDPCLLKLSDGRVALSWGRRYPEGWSEVSADGDQFRFKYPGEGYTNLAISDDEGLTWSSTIIAKRTGSCYSTIFEVEPDIIFIQVDNWFWRVTLKPRKKSS